MPTTENAPSLAAAAARLPQTPKHTFTFPDSARTFKTDPKTITLRELTLLEEGEASKGARGDSEQGVAALRASLYAVDGTRLDVAEKESVIDGWSPKIRSLALQAYIKVAIPTQEEVADFFGSMKSEPA